MCVCHIGVCLSKMCVCPNAFLTILQFLYLPPPKGELLLASNNKGQI